MLTDHDNSTFLPLLQKHLPHDWRQTQVDSITAVKSDDAIVHTKMWDLRITSLWSAFTSKWLQSFRTMVLTYQFKRLFAEFLHHMKTVHQLPLVLYLQKRHFTAPQLYKMGYISEKHNIKGGIKRESTMTQTFFNDLEAGRRALHSYMGGSFQAWDNGSTLLFWRWPNADLARDGFLPYIRRHLPRNKTKAQVKSVQSKELMFPKLAKYIKRGYLQWIDSKQVQNYMDYFAVPKGKDDIRMVFNGTSCGLNDETWSSSFWLPMSNTMTRCLSYNYKAVDVDLGEMFLNFPVHCSIYKVLGLDLTPFRELIKFTFPSVNITTSRLAVHWTRFCKESLNNQLAFII